MVITHTNEKSLKRTAMVLEGFTQFFSKIDRVSYQSITKILLRAIASNCSYHINRYSHLFYHLWIAYHVQRDRESSLFISNDNCITK